MSESSIEDKDLYIEIVTERIGGSVVASTLRKATKEEIGIEEERHANGRCRHTIIYDTPGFMYDSRNCGICHAPLGLI